MKLTSAPLGELAEFINGAAFKPTDWEDDGARIIRIQNLTDPSKPFNRTNRSVADKLRVQPGDLLVSWSATLGVFEWAGPDEGLLNQHIFRVVPDCGRVHKAYLRHMLHGALDDMERHLHGATMKHVNRGEFLSTRIPLPPLDEQRRIASILDQAERLRAKRRQALAHLDDLTQSMFLDMFGDPASNPNGYRRVVLGDVVHSASDGPHVSPKYADSGIPFISTRHVKPGRIEWRDLKYLSEDDAAVQWRKCRPSVGDILYTKGGTTGVAAAVTDNRPFAVWVHVAVLKPIAPVVDSRWLESMLNSQFCYVQSQRLTHGIANHDLGLKRMVKIGMYLPPLEDQTEFAHRVSRVSELLEVNTVQLEDMDHLFSSLQSRAFAGEL
jgi:type I restriction enzyme S subunit